MFTIKTHASFIDDSLYTNGLNAHCSIMAFSRYAVGKNRVSFFTKIQTGFLIRKRIFRCFKVLLRRKFLFLFPSFFNINLLYMFKIIQIAKNWNDTCVRGLETSHWKVRKYRPPLLSSQNNSPRDLHKAVVRLTTWFIHCDVETWTKRFAFGKSLWV